MTAKVVQMHKPANEPEGLPAIIDRARTKLAEARTSAEVFEARKFGEMALHLAKLQKAGLDVQADCILLVAQAERRLGQELIRARENDEIFGHGGKRHGVGKVKVPEANLDLAGITKKQSADWQNLARAPEDTIVEAVKAEVAAGKPPTKAAIRRAIKKKSAPAPKTQKAREAVDEYVAAGKPLTRSAIAAESGTSEMAARVAIAERRAEDRIFGMPLDDLKLSATAQQKLDAAIRAHKAKLDREFDDRVRQEAMKWVNDVRLPIYEKKIADLERMLNWPRNSVMTKAEYNKVLMCLHPDSLRSRTEEQLAEAFRIFTHYKLKMMSDDEDRKRALSDLPRTLEELLARKKKS